MALTYSNEPALGSLAPDFSLPGILPEMGEQIYSLNSFRSARGLLIVFMCNHCPYVVAVQGRINALAKEFGSKGIQVIGINPNDPVRYPDDDLEHMKVRAREEGYVFPYLQDPDQTVAKAFGAVCTPDPYLYEKIGNDWLLRYHGQIDDNWKNEAAVKTRDLALAIEAVLANRPINPKQTPSLGCSIKWKF